MKLGEKATKAWMNFLAGSGHKAFAASPQGRYGWAGGRDSVETAISRALEFCAGEKNAPGCRIIAVDERVVTGRASNALLGPPPVRLGENASKAWASYAKARGRKAFAINDHGRYGWSSNQDDIAAAQTKALRFCAGEGNARGCYLIAVDDAVIRP